MILYQSLAHLNAWFSRLDTLFSCSVTLGRELKYFVFVARQHSNADARYCYSNSVPPSVRLSVCHAALLYRNGLITVLNRFSQLVHSIQNFLLYTTRIVTYWQRFDVRRTFWSRLVDCLQQWHHHSFFSLAYGSPIIPVLSLLNNLCEISTGNPCGGMECRWCT